MTTNSDFILLIGFLERKLGLLSGKDFFIKRVHNKTQGITDPKDWARIKLPTNGFSEELIFSNFNSFIDKLEKINLDCFTKGRTILIKIPKTIDTTSCVERKQPTKLNLEPFEVYQTRFNELKNLHEKLPIFGIANRDQPDISKGIAYFNYFDKEEELKALKLFSEIGFGVEERKEKECNLTFVLMLDSIDTTNLPFGRGKLNGNTINIFSWIIKKIYRKVIESLPKGIVSGISGRGVIDCGEPEIFQIKKELEEKFGIIMLIHMSAKKRSEFFVLTTPEAKEVYDLFRGEIKACDIVAILSNSKAKKKLLKNPRPKTQKNKIMKNETLSAKVAEILRAAGFILLQDRKGGEICLQLRHDGENFTKISALGGTLEHKQTLIKKVKECFLNFKDAMLTDNGGIETTMTVSVPGLKNIVRKRRKDAKAPIAKKPKVKTKVVGESPKVDTHETLEQELKNLLNDPLLEEAIRQEILAYFHKEEVNSRARFLLANLKKG